MASDVRKRCLLSTDTKNLAVDELLPARVLGYVVLGLFDLSLGETGHRDLGFQGGQQVGEGLFAGFVAGGNLVEVDAHQPVEQDDGVGWPQLDGPSGRRGQDRRSRVPSSGFGLSRTLRLSRRERWRGEFADLASGLGGRVIVLVEGLVAGLEAGTGRVVVVARGASGQVLPEKDLPTYLCQRDGIDNARPICTAIPGHTLDEHVGQLLIATLTPLAVEAALQVSAELEHRAAEADALHAAHAERARYHADLARRRYLAVDPANRLVADTLEADWNIALRALADALFGLRARPRSGSLRRAPSGQPGQLEQVSPAEVELAEETDDLRLGYPEDLRPRQRQASQRQDHDAGLKLPGNRAADEVDHRLMHDHGLRLARGTDKTADAASRLSGPPGIRPRRRTTMWTWSGQLPDAVAPTRSQARAPASPYSHHS